MSQDKLTPAEKAFFDEIDAQIAHNDSLPPGRPHQDVERVSVGQVAVWLVLVGTLSILALAVFVWIHW